jgi:hypothetical protein
MGMKNDFRASLSRPILFGLGIGIGWIFSAPVAYAQASPEIYGCIRIDHEPDAGEGRVLRVVASTEPCRRNEIRLHWNIIGPQGPAGPMGPAGPSGPVGPAGPAGAQGPIGPTGPAGPQGLKGETGTTGPQGLQGGIGQTGATGATGSQGPKGDKGDTGATGSQGPQGAAGQTGAQGSAGPAGAQGLQGLKGDTGAQGIQGAQGTQGPQGPAGSVLVGAQNYTAGPLVSQFLATNQTFTTLSGSGFAGSTQGNPLLIQATVPLLNSSTGGMACQPAIDGKWAGTWEFPNPNAAADVYKDGIIANLGYVTWTSSRVWSNVPAGSHWFSIQCWVGGQVSFPSYYALISMSVTELR